MIQSDDKRAAAEAAVALVEPGMLVGIGTGTTVAYAIAALGRRVAEGLRIDMVATSLATEHIAALAGLAITPFDRVDRVDLAIDGVDEIDGEFRAIKGGGGAMLREKIVAAAADRMIAIADGSKRVAGLGARPVPLEVLPFARAWVMRAVASLGGDPMPRAGYTSDQGNIIIDAAFKRVTDPATLAGRLSAIPGVLGHGIFLDEIDELIASAAGVVTRVQRPSDRQEQ